MKISITGGVANLIRAVCFFFVNRISPLLFTLDESNFLLRSKAASQAGRAKADKTVNKSESLNFEKFPFLNI